MRTFKSPDPGAPAGSVSDCGAVAVTERLPANTKTAALIAGGLMIALIYTSLYWGYPFEGMVLSDSWFLYATQGGEFRWFTQSQVTNRAPVHHPDDLSPFEPDWSLLSSRRGLLPFAVLLLDRLSGGGRPVGVNALCLLVQVVNAALFMCIVWRLAGVVVALLALLCAMLYPFAAGSHFWQILSLNNISAMLFLASVALFLAIDWRTFAVNTRTACCAVASLACYWISIVVLDYAVFMGPVFLYMAVCLSNGGDSAFRSHRWIGPGPTLGLLYVLLTGLAIMLFAREAPSFLAYSLRYEELASRFGLPAQLIGAGVVAGNSMLVLTSALFSNTLGLLVYPLAALGRHINILTESWQTCLPIIMVAAGVVVMLTLCARQPTAGCKEERSSILAPGQLLAIGTMWAVLAYLPFATAFGYPRVVGLTTDRANVLALWGVAICAGLGVSRLISMAQNGPERRWHAFRAGAFFVAMLLVGNLVVQREAYVEAYRKERDLAELILAKQRLHPNDGRTPVVILERAQTLAFPRERLLQSLKEGGALAKSLAVLWFLIDRHFLGEYVTSSFHIEGIMLFGCCPQSADITFDGYARQLGAARVPVYKGEPPISITRNGQVYVIGYANTEAWSKDQGLVRGKTYPVDRFRVVRVKLEDSFFKLRGAAGYRVEDPVLPM